MPSALSEFPAYLWKYCIHCGISATLYSSVDFISMHLFICFLCACAWLCPKIVPVCHMNSSVLDCCTAPCSTQLSRSSINMIRAPVAALFSWSAWTICKVIRADQVLCIQLLLETQLYWKNTVHQSRSVASNHFHFPFSMFGIIYHRHLFQRKKRSLSSKKKMTRKPPSKTKPKPLKAKKYSTKKKHQMPGYQATAPEQHRGDIRVKIHFEIREHPIKIFPPWIQKGKSVMADFSLANLLSVEVAATSVSFRRPQQITSSLSFYANLYSSLLFSTWLR